MGSLIKMTHGIAVSSSRFYSLGKQKVWHYVGDGSQAPVSNKLGEGHSVNPADYCNIDASALVIP